MKILFLHKQILFPRDTGGKIRVLNILKHLAKWHDITYVCNLRPGEEKHLPEMERLGLRMETVPGQTTQPGSWRFYAGILANLASPYPFTIDRNFDPRLRAKLAELLAAETYDVLICDTVFLAKHTIGLPAPVTILFQHNVEAQILRRHADIASNRIMRWFMRKQWRKMVRFEKSCGPEFDSVIAVSEQDKLLFEREYGWQHVRAIDTAVDEDYFRNDRENETRGRVTFLGSMDWMPNQDGVRWFVREVWPGILNKNPDATFHIVGRNPPATIRSLGTARGVKVVGSVPDVRPHLAEASVVVVPLLVGGGTRLKIYEALAMKRAVVSTGIGAEGLPLTDGEHYVRADDPESFANAVARLLESSRDRIRIGHAADRFVRDHYSSIVVARQFEALCQSAIDSRSRVAIH